MCGIGGIYKLGKRSIRKWQLQQMACELEHRGHDATGFALQDEDGRIHTWKVARPAWVATASVEFHNWCDKALSEKTRILLVHTRAYTKGTPHNNENNHPLFTESEKGGAQEGVIVHNGMVRNDDELFEHNAKKQVHGFERSCATDSDIFRAILDSNGGVDKGLIKLMGLVDGTAAVAAFHRATPGKLLLLRDSNPLVLAGTSDTLFFASTKEAIHKVVRPWIKVHNIPMQVHAPDLSFTAMPDETGYIIGQKGLEFHDVFRCNGRNMGGYTKYVKTTGYWGKQENARLAAISERRYVHTHSHSHNSGINPTANARVTTLIHEAASKAHNGANDTPRDPSGESTLLSPGLYEYVVCPNESCNRHVELSQQDRMLASLSFLACKSCGTGLSGAPDASMSIN